MSDDFTFRLIKNSKQIWKKREKKCRRIVIVDSQTKLSFCAVDEPIIKLEVNFLMDVR